MAEESPLANELHDLLEEKVPVVVVPEDSCSVHAAGHHVVESPREFDSQ